MAIDTKIKNLIDNYVGDLPRGGVVVVGVICPEFPLTSEPSFIISQNNVRDCVSKNSLYVNGETLFNIGSVTKTFTATIQTYYKTQPASWGTVSQSLPQVTFPGTIGDVKLSDIATYMSGFTEDNQRAWFNENGARTLADFISQLDKYSGPLPQNKSGQCYSYSNFAWGLMALCSLDFGSGQGEVMPLWSQKVSNCFADLRLPMQRTRPFPTLSDAELKEMPSGFNKAYIEIFKDKFSQPNWHILGGAGNLTSTGSDIYKWLAFHMGYYWRNASTLDMFVTLCDMQGVSYQAGCLCSGSAGPSIPMTGLGWFLHKINGKSFVAKDGGVNGFSSYMGFQSWVEETLKVPPSLNGVFVLTNSQGSKNHPGGAAGLGGTIIRWLLENQAV